MRSNSSRIHQDVNTLEFLNNVGALEMAAGGDAEARTSVRAESGTESESTGSNAAAAPARETRSPIRIAFEFRDSNAATQMRIDGENAYDYKYVVMPLRI